MAIRTYLEVPYEEKDEAKRFGARWDPEARSWYVPGARIPEPLVRWTPRPPVPDLLPGEDRSFGQGLFVDLVPRSCWFTNVRFCIEPRDWERLRKVMISRAARRCEACGDTGTGHDGPDLNRALEVHERWHFDRSNPRRPVQTLRRLIALCHRCHETTHFGLAQVRGRDGVALAHLMAVTGMRTTAAEEHVNKAFSVWCERNRHQWTLDLTMLTATGITVVPPPDAADRATVADRELREHRRTDDRSSGR